MLVAQQPTVRSHRLPLPGHNLCLISTPDTDSCTLSNVHLDGWSDNCCYLILDYKGNVQLISPRDDQHRRSAARPGLQAQPLALLHDSVIRDLLSMPEEVSDLQSQQCSAKLLCAKPKLHPDTALRAANAWLQLMSLTCLTALSHTAQAASGANACCCPVPHITC